MIVVLVTSALFLRFFFEIESHTTTQDDLELRLNLAGLELSIVQSNPSKSAPQVLGLQV